MLCCSGSFDMQLELGKLLTRRMKVVMLAFSDSQVQLVYDVTVISPLTIKNSLGCNYSILLGDLQYLII
jgi:hypothetical protein